MGSQQWIFLSPHLDDVALSCGGAVWELARQNQAVEVWSICTGDPPTGALPVFAQMLHERWQTGAESSAARRAEDRTSCAILGALPRHFGWLDCIYRHLPGSDEPVIHTRDDLFRPLRPEEEPQVNELAHLLDRDLPARARVACPLGLGGHVDHRLVRAAAQLLGRPLWYYLDYPYTVWEPVVLRDWIGMDWRRCRTPLSPDGLTAWQESVAAHASQISSFWQDTAEMCAALEQYAQQRAGVFLWRAPAAKASLF